MQTAGRSIINTPPKIKDSEKKTREHKICSVHYNCQTGGRKRLPLREVVQKDIERRREVLEEPCAKARPEIAKGQLVNLDTSCIRGQKVFLPPVQSNSKSHRLTKAD